MAMLYGRNELSDITLVVGGRMYHAHRLIMCFASDVFRVMLTSGNWSDSHKQIIYLQEDELCEEVFEQFLIYLYTGCIDLCNSSVLPILVLADKYNVTDLKELAIFYMMDHLVSTVDLCRVVEWLQYAKFAGYKQFVSVCHDFILNNFHRVAVSDSFLSMERDLLCEFLSSNYLVIESEFVLHMLVNRWIEHQKSIMLVESEWMQNIVLPVLSCLRYFMMRKEQIEAISILPSFDHFKDFFHAQLELCKQYHSERDNHRISMGAYNVNEDIRIYASDAWSTSLVVDNYHNFKEYESKTVFFASPTSASQAHDNQSWEWQVDFYPKGIRYERSYMISWLRKLEVNGADYHMTRVVLQSRSIEVRKVEVALLVFAVQDGIEYVKKCILRRCNFDEKSSVQVFNDVVPFDDLMKTSGSTFLCGQDCNVLKVHIVIKPV